MLRKLAINFSQPMPLLPVTEGVPLPHATVQLHLHDPRCRKMARDTIQAAGLIALAVPELDAWSGRWRDYPPVRPHVCIAYAARHKALDGGAEQLLLQGICRARLVRELAGGPYRIAVVNPTEGHAPPEAEMAPTRRRIERLLADTVLGQLTSVCAIHHWLSEEIPMSTLIDLASITICNDMQQRYAMLAEPDIVARAVWLEEFLHRTRRTLLLAERLEPDGVINGVCHN